MEIDCGEKKIDLRSEWIQRAFSVAELLDSYI